MNTLNLSQKNNNLFSLIMLISILGYFMFKTSYRYLGDVFQALLYLGTLGALCLHKVNIFKCRIVQLFLLSIFLQTISWYNLHLLDPTYPNKLSLTWLGYLFIFFTVALWLRGDQKKINATMLAFVFGTILTCLLHSKNIYADYTKIISGLRTDYNFMNANHSAALLATSLVCVTYMTSKLASDVKYMGLLLLLSAMIVFLLMGTQSRSAYVALVIPFTILVYYSGKNSKKNLAFTIPIVLLAIGGFIYSSMPRVNSEAKVFQKKYEHNVEINNEKSHLLTTKPKLPLAKKVENLNHDPELIERLSLRENMVKNLDHISENIPYTSVGYRFHFWIDTVKQFLYNPIFGLGNNANKYILEHSNHKKAYKKKNFKHLHNSYMEIVASYGLFGVTLIGYLYFYVFKVGMRNGGKDTLILAICLYSLLGVINLFESYIFVKSGVLVHTLALGILYSYKLKGDIENEEK
ncbi:O-antigen ligase family protein [Vibrio chagasii]|uniref:O-antigen ligase family protein n=2 Tax=Vibrio chagasii TaxID=170679 RepID=A0A7V7NXN6_9VIBR|nr:O-antigen ligase family protein [Vibrio chagasii]